MKKLRKGTVALVVKLKKVNLDRDQQHIRCANCLKGSYAGYYAAASGLTMGKSDGLERLWRTVFRCIPGWLHGWSGQNPHKTFGREKRNQGSCQRRALGVYTFDTSHQ